MESPLPYLLVPLLACVALLPRWRGPAAARLIIGTFALAALHLGTGSLEPDHLKRWAVDGASQQLFLSLSTGIALGGLGLWAPRGWWWYVTAAPLGVGVLVVSWGALQVGPLVLGVVLGAMPLLVAGLAPRFDHSVRALPREGHVWPDLGVAALAIVAVATRSLALMAAAPILLSLLADRHASRRPAVLSVGATLILVALTLHALSLATQPMSVLTGMGFALPVGGGVERVIGAAILAAAICMVGPWPLHRRGAGLILVPAAVLMVYQVAGSIAPLGIGSWLPLAAMVLVPSAVAAAWRGHWGTAVGSAAILAVPRPGWPALTLWLLVMACVATLSGGNLRHPDRISFPKGVPGALLLAAAMALTAAAVLAHEVVLGVLLVAGFAAAAARPVRQLPP